MEGKMCVGDEWTYSKWKAARNNPVEVTVIVAAVLVIVACLVFIGCTLLIFTRYALLWGG